MSDSNDESELGARRATGIVNALTDVDETRCSDCGRTVDVSDAENTGRVVERLEEHRRRHHE